MRRELLLLQDIIAAIDAIALFTAGMQFEAFHSDSVVPSAVLYQLIVIGEAAHRVSAGLRERYPAIPWAGMRGLRNIAVHNYFGIDWEEVWHTITEEAPVLRERLGDGVR